MKAKYFELSSALIVAILSMIFIGCLLYLIFSFIPIKFEATSNASFIISEYQKYVIPYGLGKIIYLILVMISPFVCLASIWISTKHSYLISKIKNINTWGGVYFGCDRISFLHNPICKNPNF